MTDVLGVCTSWEDGRARVRREDGNEVEIVVADIVSGKPVPPRPSVRHRVSADEAQVLALAQWQDLAMTDLGGWTLRSSATVPNRRANSVLAMTPPGVADPIAGVVAHYEGLGQRPIASVLTDSPEEALFLDVGWVPESSDADTIFQLTSLVMARRELRARRKSAAGAGRSRDVQPIRVDIDENTSGDHDSARATVRIGDPDSPIATGLAAYSRDWLGIRAVDVDQAHRRQGLGLAVLDALLEWGAECGASTAYLQVLGDNSPALSLYGGLGFRAHHTYRYLAVPPR